MLLDNETYCPGSGAPTTTTTTTIKASTAIRIGCALSAFARYDLVQGDGAICAMGAALLGATGKLPSNLCAYNEVFKVFPFMRRNRFKNKIWNINREHGREAVADWLESIGE